MYTNKQNISLSLSLSLSLHVYMCIYINIYIYIYIYIGGPIRGQEGVQLSFKFIALWDLF